MSATTTSRPNLSPESVAPSSPRSSSGALARKIRDNVIGHLFLIGAVLCFAFFSWYPMVREFIMSFQARHFGVTKWVGWQNYKNVWHDPTFSIAWKNTTEFTLLALVFGFAAPFFIAVLLNEFRHAQGYLRALVYLPVILPPAAALYLFVFAYQPDQSGIFNDILHSLHLPMSQWVQSPGATIPSLVIASTWMNCGSGILIYMASLQDIPGDLYEAAELDGASLWGRIWHVTIPQTRLILSLMFMLQVVATMQLFIEPLILAGGDGVEQSATSVVYMIYNDAFINNNFGGAAALGVMLLIVLAVFSGLYTWLSPKQE